MIYGIYNDITGKCGKWGRNTRSNIEKIQVPSGHTLMLFEGKEAKPLYYNLKNGKLEELPEDQRPMKKTVVIKKKALVYTGDADWQALLNRIDLLEYRMDKVEKQNGK